MLSSKTKSFLGIDFWNGSTDILLEDADREGGLFTVPSAPSLAQMRRDPALMRAYQASDWAVIDGGYVALVLRFCFGRSLPRISGLQILQRLVGEADGRAIPFQERKILWVVPNADEKSRIGQFLEKSGFPADSRHCYMAPFYQTEADFRDTSLLSLVDELDPDWIVLCISGGKQEKLGHFLRSTADSRSNKRRINGPAILCTGGAISFLSGGQANIPTWADRLYLGWFLRICQSPKTFLPRYWHAGYEFPCLLWEQRETLFTTKEKRRETEG
jgi:N-acetylglucosaminyldiphosphoundecaprenol N-acetyl-beta-D-mannosaminyltransferase